MPESTAVRVCAGADLAERGRAHSFDVLFHGEPLRAFALRFDGRVVGYLNRCAHVAAEMDWNEGEFLDLDRRWIVCALHGAHYEPADGRCIVGPCRGARLVALDLREQGASVCWYPSPHLQPVAFDGDALPASEPPP